MSARGVLRVIQGGYVGFMCPGCEEMHVIAVGEGQGPRWSFNGDHDRPTFEPSVLVRSGHYVPGHQPSEGCWCTYCREDEADGDPGFSCKQCHSFVRDGQIQFLGDCSHVLAGRTVPLKPFD